MLKLQNYNKYLKQKNKQKHQWRYKGFDRRIRILKKKIDFFCKIVYYLKNKRYIIDFC